jgi:N utilization substance protein B
LDVLFEADQRGLDPAGLAQNRLADDGPSAVFARSLVEGVVAHAEQIDEALETYSLGWPLAKMPAVDRSIARLGAFEILFSDGVPDAVVMGEAADLAGILSTDRSPNFISGLLGRISEMK